MTTIEKTISSEIRKWISFDVETYFIKEVIKNFYYGISVGDYDSKKKSFIKLYYLKMKKDYFYLKIYHFNIKKLSSNERLLKYYESILLANGFKLEI